MQQFSDQTQKFISEQTPIKQSHYHDQNQILDNIVDLPFQNIFDLQISDANQTKNEQPNNQIKEMVDQMLISISNNEEILGTSSNHLTEDLNDLLEDDDLECKEIQYQLFQKALNKNCILHQEDYNTQVALILMWNQLYKYTNKKVVILATTIPKAENLAKQIQIMLPRLIEKFIDDQIILEKAKEYCNAVKIIHPNKCTDLWNNLVWQKMLQANQIYVMTGETYINTLRRGFQQFKDFSFILLDDCQTAIFDNSYNHLLKEFYFPLKSSQDLPLIVGIYNSIIYSNNKFISDESILKDIVQLCAIMDACFLNVNVESVKQRLKETSITISTYKQYFNHRKLHQILESKTFNKELDNYLNNDITKINLIEVNDLKLNLTKLKIKYQNNFSFKIVVYFLQHLLIYQPLNLYLELGQYPFCFILEFIIEKYKIYIRSMQTQPMYQELLEILEKSLVQSKLSNNLITPKYKLLQQLIVQTYQNHQTSNIRTLIQVKQRYTAFFISKLLVLDSSTFQIQDLKIGIILRSINDQDIKQKLNDFSRIQQVIYQDLQKDQFKFSIQELKNQLIQLNQLFNLDQLIFQSTDIDVVNQCHIVIQTQLDVEFAINFSKIIFFSQTPHSYFNQLMYQIRNTKLQFIMMKIEDNNQKQKTQPNIFLFSKVEKIIDECTMPQRDIILQKAILNLQSKASQNNYYESYLIKQSGALLNTNWACSLIENFIQQISLEKKVKTISRYAIYQIKSGNSNQNHQYIAFLLLPNQVQNFVFYGNVTQGSKEAKASAAFQAVLKLLQKGYFDFHLRSQIQNNLGQRIGANQEHPLVIITQNQLDIISKYCLTVNQNETSLLKGLIKQQKYYLTYQKSLILIQQQETNFIKQTCVFQNEKISLIYPKQFKTKLSQCETLLQMTDIYLGEECQISQEDFQDFYKKYIEQVIQEENLILMGENNYTRINQEIQFNIKSEIPLNGLILVKDLNKNSKFTINYIVNQFCIILKSSLFKQNIENQLQNQKNVNEINQLNTNPNYILSNLNEYFNQLTPIKLNLKGQNIDLKQIQNINRQEKIINNGIYQKKLDQIILESLNLSNQKPENIILGQYYYIFLITIQLLVNYPKIDSKILEQKIKYYTSSIYIRNCLIESYLFLFLHKIDLVDISKTLIGVEKVDNNYDQLLQQSNMDQFECYQNQRDNQRFKNSENISDLEFQQFLEQSLSIIEQKDQYLINGFQWIRTLKLTKILEKQISSSQDLKFLVPGQIWKNEKLTQLTLIYNLFEEKISYRFKSFELLFQAMTDVSIKMIINNKIQMNYIEKFSTKEEFQGQISQTELQEQIKQIDQMESIDQSTYQNCHLKVLGKSIWDYTLIKILREKNLEILSFVTLNKILKGVSFLCYAAIKLRIHQYLNTNNQQQLQDFVELYEKSKDQAITFHVSSLPQNGNAVMLRNAFLALVGAIYIDSQFELSVIYDWIKQLLNQIGFQQLLNSEFLQSRPRYRFYQWYKSKKRNPLNFDLVKIPHQDQKKMNQGIFLYVPFDKKEGQIVNIKGEKFYEIEQLHIYAKFKSEAWDKLNELIEY